MLLEKHWTQLNRAPAWLEGAQQGINTRRNMGSALWSYVTPALLRTLTLYLQCFQMCVPNLTVASLAGAQRRGKHLQKTQESNASRHNKTQ